MCNRIGINRRKVWCQFSSGSIPIFMFAFFYIEQIPIVISQPFDEIFKFIIMATEPFVHYWMIRTFIEKPWQDTQSLAKGLVPQHVTIGVPKCIHMDTRVLPRGTFHYTFWDFNRISECNIKWITPYDLFIELSVNWIIQ